MRDVIGWIGAHPKVFWQAASQHVSLSITALAAAIGTTTVNDLDAALWLERPPGSGGPTYDGASIVLPDSPGLGIEEARP